MLNRDFRSIYYRFFWPFWHISHVPNGKSMLFSQFHKKNSQFKEQKKGGGNDKFSPISRHVFVLERNKSEWYNFSWREIINDCTFFWLVSYSAVLISVRRGTILVNRKKQYLKPFFAMFAFSLVLIIPCGPVNVETESRNFSALEAQRVYR